MERGLEMSASMLKDDLRNGGYVLFEGIRGSRLYGLDTETSDTDTHALFIAPQDWLYGIRRNYPNVIQSERHDDTWDELEKFIIELGESNPNSLELLYTPKEFTIVYNSILDPLFEIRDKLITKRCFISFGNYAEKQIRKAKSLNKAININPQEVKERKSPLHFCNVIDGCKSIPLDKWLEDNGLDKDRCGLVRLPRGIELYALYYDKDNKLNYRGILDKNNPTTQLRLSSIPKGEVSLCSFQFNINAYSDHCNKYKRYWDWVKNRNEERYLINKDYGFNAKNLSQAVRLFNISIEIAEGKGLILDRRNIDRELLLDIKNHKMSYTEIITYIESLKDKMDLAFSKSTLPDSPDRVELERILINIRKEFYKQ